MKLQMPKMSPEAQKIHDDVFYGRIFCQQTGCRRIIKERCNNIQCAIECNRIVNQRKQEKVEQISLFNL